MVDTLTINISAILALIPATLYQFSRNDQSETIWWATIIVAEVGSLAAIWLSFDGIWRTSFSLALWITVAACIMLYAALAAKIKTCRQLGPLLLPYLLGLGILATLWGEAPERPMISAAPSGWIALHIATSILTYAILTLAAISGLAVTLRQHWLNSKQPISLYRILPSMADAERLQVGLMIAAQVVLSLGLVSGITTQFYTTGDFLVFDHKILLTFAVFLTIGGMLVVYFRTGLAGRKVAQIILIAYLFLTLGYPGVKFVRDVLLV